MELGHFNAQSITVKTTQARRILDREGQLNEVDIWGKPTDGCDFAGSLCDSYGGLMIKLDAPDFRCS